LWACVTHYGLILRAIGLEQGFHIGNGKDIRSDEWAVFIPLFQQVIRNNFERFISNGFYSAIDLRGFIGLPLYDWALFFKPYMWPFFIAQPARAFALYNGAMVSAFLAGYYFLLRGVLIPHYFSLMGATLLFFTYHNQAWMSGHNLAVLALTP
jgi:hypothetical protein